MTAAEQIQSLAQGDYPELTQSAIDTGVSVDQFFADLVTMASREPVQIAEGQQLVAGEVLFATVGTSVSAAGGNTGNGTLTVNSIAAEVVAGVYKAQCVAASSNAGIFELRRPNGGTVARINVGTALESDDLNLTIADGSTDFIAGDSFNVTVTIGAPYAAYDWTSDAIQIAAAVLADDVDTTGGAAEQFATASGPAIIPTNFPTLTRTSDVTNQQIDPVLLQASDQLGQRGIVLRGPIGIRTVPAVGP